MIFTVGPLPKTPKGNRYVLVIGDYFTKWIEAVPIPNYTAKACAHAILTILCTSLEYPFHCTLTKGGPLKASGKSCALS